MEPIGIRYVVGNTLTHSFVYVAIAKENNHEQQRPELAQQGSQCAVWRGAHQQPARPEEVILSSAFA
jgi:hypothetical protein